MEPEQGGTGHIIPTDDGPKLALEQDEAKLLSRDLYQRTTAYVEQNIADPMSLAMEAARNLDERAGIKSSEHMIVVPVGRLNLAIAQLPQDVAGAAYDTKPNPEGRVVPDQTVDAMHAALKAADGMTRYGRENDQKAHQVRAAASVLYGHLQQIDALLGPDPINSNIVDPAVQPYGP